MAPGTAGWCSAAGAPRCGFADLHQRAAGRVRARPVFVPECSEYPVWGLQQSWYAIISIYAQRLFWGLAAIDFGWTALTLILDQNDLLEFFGVLVRKIITLGFFFGLLKMAGVWIPDIIDSFRRIGAAAGAVPATTTPDGVVNEGYELALGAFQAMRELGVL